MRIAQIAPLYESVPPRFYGGTERVAAYLTDELVRLGHQVTLFASGDSSSLAHVVSVCDQGLRLKKDCNDPMVYHVLMLEEVYRRAKDFDVLHFHTDYLHFSWSRRQRIPSVTTLHGRLDLAELVPLYEEFLEAPVVSISNSQRLPLPWLNWQRTIYHGLPPNLYRFEPDAGKYLAFIGRISPEKGVDQAIEIAKRFGMKLRIAAKIDRVDQDYFNSVVEPLLDDPLIEFIGEIGDAEKDEFLGGAFALLAPVNWAEPFGLVLIEAMACGTPVVAFNRGSIPEIIEDGVTGFVVRDAEQAVQALENVPGLSRKVCRQVFEQRFTAERMAEDYLKAYERLCEGAALKLVPRRRASWTRSSA